MAESNQWKNETVLTPVAARQGLISGRVRLILVVSLTLVIAAFAIIYAMPL